MAAIALAICMPASASAGAGAHGIRVSVVTRTQAQALRAHAVRVRVRGARVRLFATVRRRGAHSAGVVATRVRDVRARRARVISLRLGRAGLRALRACGRMRVTVSAAPAGTPQSGPGRARHASRTLRRDARRCKRSGGGPGGGGGGTGGGGSGGGGGTSRGQQAPVDYTTPADAGRCDWLDTAVCLQPWPNDYFTTSDATTATKLRLNLDIQSTPRNRAGKPIDPADYNRNDGFSPGTPIVTKIPGLDTKRAFDNSGIVPMTDMGRAFAPRQPLVVIDTRTRARHLVWAELDANPKDPANVNLIVRPGRNFQEGTRYVVALRNLVDASGKPIPATRAFRIYRDGILTTNSTVEARRGRFESMFDTLAQAGIDRDSLYLAWDFTTASERNLSERMLAIRNAAYRQLGDTNLADLNPQGSSPQFTVTEVDPTPTNPYLDHIVRGKITVPCYLDLPKCPSGSRFLYPPGSTNGPPIIQPIPGNTYDASFRCNIPRAAANAPARPSLYGHGLFGSRDELNQDQIQMMGQEHNFVFCATEWIGMACADLPDPTNPASVLRDPLAGHPPPLPECDVPNVATVLGDLSNFSTLTDRVQQGMVDFMYLGRAMLKGFNGDPAFQMNGHPVIDPARLFYDGNSQGGIIGGSLIAVEPDLDRGVIGVPGMNYSTLLQRSHDFGEGKPPSASNPIPEYAYPLYQAYPNEIERPLILALIQTLWDRAEADGYALHMTTDPLPDTPAHHVLMQGGVGDWQVAQIAAETEARTIGASTHGPYADAGRTFDVSPGFGLPRIGAFPFDGSAYMLYDSGPPRREGNGYVGTNPPPPSNTIPPIQPPSADQQQDPHEVVRRTLRARQQKDAFLRIGGVVIDVCGSRPCYSGTWAGP
ncbi:MAG: hypothetical protein QOF37_3092 [Thermoleophilaceae bacterium]|nr:hypothetical protein [Thermoleophilaceae bacterium]